MQNYLFDIFKRNEFSYPDLVALGLIICLIVVITIITHLILHKVILKSIECHYAQKGRDKWMNLFIKHQFFNRIILTLQGLVVYIQAKVWLNNDELIQTILLVVSQIWILIFITLSFFSILDIWLSITQKNGLAKRLPIRGINQSIKLIVTVFIAILVISLLINRSPILLLSGLGAMTAVLMLVFKDPLLGLVAGIQLSVNKMLNVGDWLEMPKYGADGDVIDITLTTVKVQNWDKTISTIPTYALISDSFKNWQGMSESGGRRIKRSIFIDTTSVYFLTQHDCDTLKQAQLLAPYIDNKINEITQYNRERQIDTGYQINGRRLTNLGTFRAYLEAYLHNHPQIHQNMTLMVRQLAPTSNGLPIEIYAFTNTTQWVAYENIQADIFDHIFAIIPEFGLRVHQTPTGNDVRALGEYIKR
ncbi:miniconductance mechanosensitive channel [Orbus hercynius]|uniref:Mechanosensing system component YbdG n=1 Tax=Orbus hercynius TaxID=593135 RepID=A0A495RCY2_9GAMM|nr:mechanosensitive ion channel family protein [Orbus hercynius]RKS85211.1 miniconductance mechanosensitive channel [Orbus hercynius]